MTELWARFARQFTKAWDHPSRRGLPLSCRLLLHMGALALAAEDSLDELNLFDDNLVLYDFDDDNAAVKDEEEEGQCADTRG